MPISGCTYIVGPVGEVEAEVLDGVLRSGRNFRVRDDWKRKKPELVKLDFLILSQTRA